MFSLQRCIRQELYSKWNFVRKYSANIQPIKMAYKVFQSAQTDPKIPPFLIMHGLFGSKQNWRSACNALKTKTNRKIYALDARNHGESPHTNEHGSNYITADTVHLMQQLNLQKVAVMGHSMGGRAMMYMALKYPELVERLIVVDISPIALPKDFSTIEKIFNAMRSVNIPKELSLAEGRKYAENHMNQHVAAHETVQFILMNLKKTPDGTFKWAFNLEGLYNTLRAFHSFIETISGLKPYQGDVLFICGNQSNFVDPQSEPLIKTIFPKSQFEWLDAGHLVHFDQPQKFIKLLSDFLNK